MARQKRDQYRELLKRDINPGTYRKTTKAKRLEIAGNTFEVITREWAIIKGENVTTNYIEHVLRRFELNVFPWLGKQPITEVTAPELLKVIRRIEESGRIETASRSYRRF